MNILQECNIVCFSVTAFYRRYLEIFPGFLSIIPWLPFLGIIDNRAARKIGHIYYTLPIILAIFSDFLSYYIGIQRPIPECLTNLQSPYGIPCSEIVGGCSFFIVEILYTSYVKWNTLLELNFFIAKKMIIIATIPIFSVLIYTATIWQAIASFGFALLIVPLFLLLKWTLEKFECWNTMSFSKVSHPCNCFKKK